MVVIDSMSFSFENEWIVVVVVVGVVVVVVVVVVVHQFSVLESKKYVKTKEGNENEKENEKCYYFVLAFFDENVTLSLEGFCA